MTGRRKALTVLFAGGIGLIVLGMVVDALATRRTPGGVPLVLAGLAIQVPVLVLGLMERKHWLGKLAAAVSAAILLWVATTGIACIFLARPPHRPPLDTFRPESRRHLRPSNVAADRQ